MLFDTHAHLNDARFDADRSEVLARARAAGVGRVVEIADAPEEWDRALALSRARPEIVRCALGLHPYHADRWEPGLAERLRRKARLPEVVAAGEIGLDYFTKCTVPREVQRRAFSAMLEAADAAELPVVVHCREAYADLLPMLRDFYSGRAPRGRGGEGPARFHGVLHCFSGTREEALRCAALGFALGVDGPATYPKNDGLRDALRAAGLEQLVLETDSPFLPPQSARGKRNEPEAVREINAALARVFGRKEEEVAALTTSNARDLFRLAED